MVQLLIAVEVEVVALLGDLILWHADVLGDAIPLAFDLPALAPARQAVGLVVLGGLVLGQRRVGEAGAQAS